MAKRKIIKIKNRNKQSQKNSIVIKVDNSKKTIRRGDSRPQQQPIRQQPIIIQQPSNNMLNPYMMNNYSHPQPNINITNLNPTHPQPNINVSNTNPTHPQPNINVSNTNPTHPQPNINVSSPFPATPQHTINVDDVINRFKKDNDEKFNSFHSKLNDLNENFQIAAKRLNEYKLSNDFSNKINSYTPPPKPITILKTPNPEENMPIISSSPVKAIQELRNNHNVSKPTIKTKTENEDEELKKLSIHHYIDDNPPITRKANYTRQEELYRSRNNLYDPNNNNQFERPKIITDQPKTKSLIQQSLDSNYDEGISPMYNLFDEDIKPAVEEEVKPIEEVKQQKNEISSKEPEPNDNIKNDVVEQIPNDEKTKEIIKTMRFYDSGFKKIISNYNDLKNKTQPGEQIDKTNDPIPETDYLHCPFCSFSTYGQSVTMSNKKSNLLGHITKVHTMDGKNNDKYIKLKDDFEGYPMYLKKTNTNTYPVFPPEFVNMTVEQKSKLLNFKYPSKDVAQKLKDAREQKSINNTKKKVEKDEKEVKQLINEIQNINK